MTEYEAFVMYIPLNVEIDMVRTGQNIGRLRKQAGLSVIKNSRLGNVCSKVPWSKGKGTIVPWTPDFQAGGIGFKSYGDHHRAP